MKFLINIFNDILFKDKLPEKWMLSSLEPIFKGKEDLLNPNSYRGIKFLENTFRLHKILDGRLREVVDIDKMKHGGLCQRKGLLMLLTYFDFCCLFWGDFSEPKIRHCFLYLLTWKRPLIGCKGKLFASLWDGRGSQNICKSSYASLQKL